MDPRYRGIQSSDIPEVTLHGGARAKIVAGEVSGVTGPVTDIVTDPEYLDITIPADVQLSHMVDPGRTVLAYVIDGSGYFDQRRDSSAYEAEGANYFDLERDCRFGSGTLVAFGDGDELAITTSGSPVRFLLFTGKPVGEPVAWYGPIVMNTQEELRVAFEEYGDGTFIKHR
jgi:hypothetical protein